MELVDRDKTSKTLGLLAALLFADVGLRLLGWLVPGLLDSVGGFDVWFKVQSFIWGGMALAFAYALWELTRGARSELLVVALGSAGVLVALQLYWVVDQFVREPGEHRNVAVGLLSQVVGLAWTVSVCFAIGKLGRTTAFAAGLSVFAAILTLSGIGLTLRLAETPPRWAYDVRSGLSLVVTLGMAALTLHARKGVAGAQSVLDAPVAQAPIVEASGMRLILVGVALLVLGVGGSAVSFSAASQGSGGGRYVVFTGAIATGLVQLVRGLTRLGKGG